MRMSDFIKKNGDEEEPKDSGKENFVVQKNEAEQDGGPAGESLSQTAADIYNDIVYLGQKNWSNMEKGNPPDMGRVREIADKIVNNSGILSELLAVMIRTHILTDNYLPVHSVNVAILSVYLGHALSYEKAKLTDLGIAGVLHDIGMFGTQEDILRKRGELTPEERTHIKEHAIRGANMAKTLEGINEFIIEGILFHHEREDGSGYYSKKPEEHISEFAKIINIADTYEALTHPRPYRKALSPERAMKQILSFHIKNFSEGLLKKIVNNVFFYPIGSLVLLSSGEIARVKKLNPNSPIRPIIEIIIDQKGHTPKEKRIIDMMQKPMVSIKDSLTEEELLELIEKDLQ